MSLTYEDLQQIRAIVKEEIGDAVSPLRGEIKALREDIKELYDRVVKLEKRVVTSEKRVAKVETRDDTVNLNLSLKSDDFESLSPEEQTLRLYKAVVTLAQKQGVALPR